MVVPFIDMGKTDWKEAEWEEKIKNSVLYTLSLRSIDYPNENRHRHKQLKLRV